jgi:hypothetical protein
MEQVPKYLIVPTMLLMLCVYPLYSENATAGEGPDSVVIDALAQLYDPVEFDHAMHEEATDGNCSTCHHHTLGTPVEDENCARCHAGSEGADEVTCQGCHAAKRFEADYLNQIRADNTIHHTDKVGLKAAYHLRCMSCHVEMEAPNGCQDCHARNQAGDKFFHAGSYSPPKSSKTSHGGGH